MKAMWLLLAILCSSFGMAQDAKESAKSETYSDEALFEAFAKLSAKDQKMASEWFLADAGRLPIFQNTLIAHAKKGWEKSVYRWPKPEPDPVFDPALHAPAQPIPRVALDVNSPKYKKEFERLLGWREERRLDSAWGYDFARQTVVQVADWKDPERIFHNGIRGFAPDLDLAEALNLMRLDDGEFVESHRAFGHRYAIRNGDSFPGITLYDAWSSGRKIEMPDVECLGLIHVLLDDWKSFVAPVSRQKPLYAMIEKLYVPMHRARSLRIALARNYLIASPVLWDGYAGTEDFMHLTWEEASSDPLALKGKLPSSAKWEKWLENGQKRLRKKKQDKERASGRREHLLWGEAQVRQVCIQVLIGMEVLAKK